MEEGQPGRSRLMTAELHQVRARRQCVLLHRKLTTDARDALCTSKGRIQPKDTVSEETEIVNLYWIKARYSSDMHACVLTAKNKLYTNGELYSL